MDLTVKSYDTNDKQTIKLCTYHYLKAIFHQAFRTAHTYIAPKNNQT